MSLAPKALEALQARLLAAAAAPPSARILEPVMKEAAQRGRAAASAVRQPVDARVSMVSNTKARVSFDGPGQRVAARVAMQHIDSRAMKVMAETYQETVRNLGGSVR